MSLWRKAAWVAGIGMMLAVAAGIYLVARFDADRYKGLLTERVAQDYQRTLTLAGPIRLSVWPSLQVRLQGVSLSEHQGDARFASIEEARLGVQVLPLLRGQFRVDQVQASGVSLRYVRDAQGRSNIDDLLKGRAGDDAGADEGEPLRFEVAGIALRGVTMQVEDALSGLQGHALVERLDSGRIADGVPADMAFLATLTTSQPRFASLRAEGSVVLTPFLAQAGVRLEDLAVSLEGQGAGLREGRAEIKAGSLQRDAETGVLIARGLEVEGAAVLNAPQGAEPLRLDKIRLSLERFEFETAARTLVLQALAASASGRQGEAALNAELAWPSLRVKDEQLQGSAVQGRFQRSGPVAVDAQLSSQAPAGGFEQMRLPGTTVDFQLTMRGEGGDRTVKGQARADLMLAPQAGQAALTGLAMEARIQEPALQALTLKVSGQANGQTDGSARWALQGQLNDHPFSTRGKLDLSGPQPNVDATAHFDALDLNRLLPVPASAAKDAAEAPSGARDGGAASGGDAEVDLSFLQAMDGRFDFSAGRLQWRHYRLGDVKAVARIQEGTLALQSLSGAGWGGRFQAQGSAKAAAPQRVALKADAQGVDVQALLKDVAGKDMLQGRGDMGVNVTAEGRRMSALTSSLDGTAAIKVRDGAVKGINLAKSLREARARLSGRQDALQEARQTEKTDFTEMSATFQVSDGVATNRDLSAKSPFLRVTGQGRIDLARRQLDYTVQTTVTGTVKGQDGADLDMLKGLTVPVSLTGSFEDPAWKINWSAVAVGSMQNTLKGRIEDALRARLEEGRQPAQGAASAASAPAPAAVTPEEALRRKLREGLKGLLK